MLANIGGAPNRAGEKEFGHFPYRLPRREVYPRPLFATTFLLRTAHSPR